MTPHAYRRVCEEAVMTKLLTPLATIRTLADLLEKLGDIDPGRVRFHPPPGTATEKELIAVYDRENWPCELVDGVLVEKAVGTLESLLASALIHFLGEFVYERDLGVVLGE